MNTPYRWSRHVPLLVVVMAVAAAAVMAAAADAPRSTFAVEGDAGMSKRVAGRAAEPSDGIDRDSPR